MGLMPLRNCTKPEVQQAAWASEATHGPFNQGLDHPGLHWPGPGGSGPGGFLGDGVVACPTRRRAHDCETVSRFDPTRVTHVDRRLERTMR